MKEESRNHLKKLAESALVVILLSLLFARFTDLMYNLVYIVIVLSFGTEKGLTFFRNKFSQNLGLKFLGIALILTIISSIEFYGFNKKILVPILFSILLFGLPFFILQWKNKNIQNPMPIWRDFLILFYIDTSYFIISYYFLTMGIWIPFSILIYLVLFLVVRNFSREDIGYKLKIDIKDIICVFVGFLLMLIIAAVLEVGIHILGSKYFLDYLYIGIKDRISSLLSSPLNSYIHYIFITGLGEELEFRGLLLGLIRKKLQEKWYGTILALLISSFAFGFAHYFKHDFYRCIFDSIYGLILGIIFIRTKKLVAPILLHALGDI